MRNGILLISQRTTLQ